MLLLVKLGLTHSLKIEEYSHINMFREANMTNNALVRFGACCFDVVSWKTIFRYFVSHDL